MSSYPQVGDYPEALVRILLTVMERTPQGGATMEELKGAYQEARGRHPSDKTIYRAIRRLNRIFDPLVYEDGEEESDMLDVDTDENGRPFAPAVQSRRDGVGTRYVFTGELPGSILDSNHALLVTLCLYSQQKGLLKGHFKIVIGELLRDLLSRSEDFQHLLKQVEENVHVSGYGPSDPGKDLARIKEIMRAISLCKRLRMDYLRSYDGTLTVREVEPYGLICRFNKWYLVSYCLQQEKRRVFLLDHIRRLQVLEATTFQWPAGFSLQDTYGYSWGVWTEDEPGEPETVRLQVGQGLAQRFQRVNFHHTQNTKLLPDGSAQVTFTVQGAQEMIPWLMSWGSAVQLLEPAWLREELVHRVQETLQVYQA